YEYAARGKGCRGYVSRRPLLPAERDPLASSSLARTQGGDTANGELLPKSLFGEVRQKRYQFHPADHRPSDGMRLGRKCSAALQRNTADSCPRRGRRDDNA